MESRLPGEISITSDRQTTPYGRKQRETKEPIVCVYLFLYFKELSHKIIEAGKSKIYSLNLKVEDPGNS